MLSLLFLILGFLPLVYGANFLVDGASSVAKKFNIPNIVIGLTIVAFGTSAPELVVNILSSINKASDITLGNIIGSNIFNVAGILGITAIITPLAVKSNTTWKEIPLSLLAAVTVGILINDKSVDGELFSKISRIDGIILIFFFLIFMAYTYTLMQSGGFEEEGEIKNYTLTKATMFIILGLAGLVIGGKVIVENAVSFARYVGLSERVIGLTIVSIGTSLPELATSISAALKKNADIAIGNVVGSNIFNIFFVLGLSGIIYPIPLKGNANTDILLNIILSILLFSFVFIVKGRKIERWEGIIFSTIYICYTVFLLTVK